MRAEKIYYLRNHPEIETHLQESTAPLRDKLCELVGKNNVLDCFCDFYDLESMVEIIARISRDEKAAQNDVFINLAGGTNITLAGMMSAQLFGCKPYFLKTDFLRDSKEIQYHKESNWILEPHVYPVKIPEKEMVIFLSKIVAVANKSKTNDVSKKDCVEIMIDLEKEKEISPQTSSRLYNRLKSRYLGKLADFGYIQFDNTLRGKVLLLKEGKFAAKMFSIFYGIL